MIIISFSPYKQYLYSPQTYIHNIKIKFKIYFILMYLFVIPFKLKLCCILIYFYSIFLYSIYKYIKFKSKYFSLLIQQLFITKLVFFLFITLYQRSSIYKYQLIKIYYPYKILLDSSIIIKLYSYYLPNILIKTIILLYTNVSLFILLFLTTKFEDLLIYTLYITNQLKYNIKPILFFSLSLTCQFLYIIMIQYDNYKKSQKIRKLDQYKNKQVYNWYYLIFIVTKIINHISKTTSMLYSLEITYNNFYFICI
uniref:Transmembrane protein n=1 Tax=Gayliella sp. TaxID=2575623 RepID=A0A4D6WVT8_9FLOR|nr:hypothetical protein [Gayliella sp.]